MGNNLQTFSVKRTIFVFCYWKPRMWSCHQRSHRCDSFRGEKYFVCSFKDLEVSVGSEVHITDVLIYVWECFEKFDCIVSPIILLENHYFSWGTCRQSLDGRTFRSSHNWKGKLTVILLHVTYFVCWSINSAMVMLLFIIKQASFRHCMCVENKL